MMYNRAVNGGLKGAILAATIFLCSSASAQEITATELEKKLGSSQGIERGRILAHLTEAFRSNDPQQAIEYGQEALAIFETNPDPRLQVLALGEMGWAYMMLGQYQKAVDHNEKARDLAEKNDDQEGLSRALSNLGFIARRRGRPTDAINYFKQSLEIRKQLNSKKGIADSTKDIGDAYMDLGSLDLAENNLNEALRLYEQLEDKGGIVLNLISLSALHRKRGQYVEAEKFSTDALKLATSLSGKQWIRQALEELVAAQEAAGNYSTALATHKKFKEVNDSIYNGERTRRLALLERSNELEKREAEIEKLKKEQAVSDLHLQRERFQRNALLGVAIFLGIVGVLIHRKRVESAHITEKLSLLDPLTGLRNKRFVSQTIDYDIASSLRKYQDALKTGEAPHKADHVFLMIGLDDFKLIKKQYGRSAGDEILIQIATLLQKACRATDTIVRWDKEEFLLISRFSNRAFAGKIAERVRSLIESADLKIGEETIHCTCSVGFAAYPFIQLIPDAFNWEQVIAFANGSLLTAKRSRNAWIGLHTTEKASLKDATDGTYKNLRSWIDQGELSVVSSLPPSAIQW